MTVAPQSNDQASPHLRQAGVLVALGFLAIGIGAALIWLPLGIVVFGLMFVIAGMFVARFGGES